jgi:hypothetical protein
MRPPQFAGQCSAKSKRSQQQCRNFACRGRHVCRMHGGTSLRSVAHPGFKDGRHVADWPFSIGVAVCPKCRRKHGTQAERERRDRVMTGRFLRGYEMGCNHGYRDGYHAGFNAGQDAAFKAAARRSQD